MMAKWLGREPTHIEVVVAMVCATVLLVAFMAALVLDDLVGFSH